jgi:hypothetical protein
MRFSNLAFGLALALSAASGAVAQTTTASSSWNDAALGLSSSDAATAPVTGSCSTTVQTQLTGMEQQQISGQTALAANNYKFLTTPFSSNSCLANLLNGGLNVLFEPPSLSAILAAMVSEVCSVAENYEHEAIAPIAQSLQQGLPSYEIAPGITTGSLGGGMFIDPSVGTGLTSNPVQVNVTPIFGYSTTTFTPQFQNGLLP